MDFPHVRRLFDWSINYDSYKNPYCLFLDLIGWSHDTLGESLYKDDPSDVLGYVELEMLIDALIEFRNAPDDDIYEFVNNLERDPEDED